MKRILLITALFVMGFGSAQAQSLGDIFSAIMGTSNASEQKEAPKAVHPTAQQLADKWTYIQFEFEVSENDIMAAVLKSAQSQFASLSENIGLKAGEDYIQFKSNGTLIFGLGDNEVPATYSYIPPTGTVVITINNNGEKVLVTAKATLVEKCLKIMFNAKELFAVANNADPSLSENTAFVFAQTLVNSYDNIMVGATFE